MRRIAVALVPVLLVGCGSRETGAPPPAPAVRAAPVAATPNGPTATPTTPAAATTTPADPGATVMPAEVGSLPARAVCVASPEGTLSPATVQASIAGVYDPNQPLLLAHLNWMAPGIGCVTFPGASTRVAACGGPGPAPVVAHALCQQ